MSQWIPGGRYQDLFRALMAPFDDVKQRQGGRGRMLDYVTARQVMNRLDDVLGPENWTDVYFMVDDVLFCRLTITLPDGTQVSKTDSGGYKEMMEAGKVDEENTDKTGSSDAFKRAAAKFGVARYLYKDGLPRFAQGGTTAPRNGFQASPEAATPRQAPTSDRPAPSPAPTGDGYDGRHGPLPRSVKGIYPWTLEQEKKHRNLDLKKALSAYGTKHFKKWKTQEWTESEMAQAMAECAIPLLDEVAVANP